MAEIKIADVAKALEEAEAGKKAAQEKAVEAESKIAGFAKALELAEAEKEAAQEKAMAAKTVEITLPFPLSLVSQAMENGSKVSADLQKTILAELNAKASQVETASSFSKLSTVPTKSGQSTGAAQIENLEDLQPSDTGSSGSVEARNVATLKSLIRSKEIRNVLGEFAYAGKTCRLFEYQPPRLTEALVLIACKTGVGEWKIVQRENLP